MGRSLRDLWANLKNKLNSPNPARDAAAGLSLASMNIPQLMGYAKLAGMPVATGLYTALLPVLAFALLGSSRHLVVAADSATAVIFSSIASHLAPPGGDRFIALAGMTALLTAVLLFLARAFKLGFLGDFLSRTVLLGFLTGVGLQVSIAMLAGLLGLHVASPHSLEQLWLIARNIDQMSLVTSALSFAIIAVILLGKRFAPKSPIPLFVIAAVIAASAGFDLSKYGVETLGPIAGGFPKISFPHVDWADFLALFPAALSCFIMIVAQSAATARAFAVKYREQEDLNADILGLGAANLAAALSGAFVVNGSPTQTSMAAAAGARSQLAQIAFALVVLAVLSFFMAPLRYLPSCALSAIVFTIAVGMVDIAGIRAVYAESWGEAHLAALTAAMVVVIGVEQGVLLAIVLSLLRHVRHNYHPLSCLYGKQNGALTREPPAPGAQTQPGVIAYWFGGDLFYANINGFVRQFTDLIDQAPQPVTQAIVDAHSMTTIDYSAAVTLRDVMRDLGKRGISVVFCDVAPSLRDDLRRHKLNALIEIRAEPIGDLLR